MMGRIYAFTCVCEFGKRAQLLVRKHASSGVDGSSNCCEYPDQCFDMYCWSRTPADYERQLVLHASLLYYRYAPVAGKGQLRYFGESARGSIHPLSISPSLGILARSGHRNMRIPCVQLFDFDGCSTISHPHGLATGIVAEGTPEPRNCCDQTYLDDGTAAVADSPPLFVWILRETGSRAVY